MTKNKVTLLTLLRRHRAAFFLTVIVGFPLIDVHAQAFDPTLSLFAAAANGNLPAAEASVIAGADVNARNERGLTATEIAVDKGYFKVAHYLLSIGGAKGNSSPAKPTFTIATQPSAPPLATVPGRLQPMAAPPKSTRQMQAGASALTAKAATTTMTAKAGASSVFDPNMPLTPGIPGAPAPVSRPLKPTATPSAAPTDTFMNKLNATLSAPAAPSPPAEQLAATNTAAAATNTEEAGTINRFFDKMTSFFSTGDPTTLAPDTVDRPARTSQRPARFASAQLQLAQRGGTGRSNAQAPLRIGKEGSLHRQAPPTEFGVNLPCISKRRKTVLICVENVTWPSDMAPHFGIDTVLYRGRKMITRYNNGRAAFIHVVFPSRSYPAIVQHFTRLYGPPTETWTRTVAPLGEPRRGNPVQVWFGHGEKTKQPVFLEVRQFDDARADFPDMERGAVLLHYENATPIFPMVSKIELMLIR